MWSPGEPRHVDEKQSERLAELLTISLERKERLLLLLLLLLIIIIMMIITIIIIILIIGIV